MAGSRQVSNDNGPDKQGQANAAIPLDSAPQSAPVQKVILNVCDSNPKGLTHEELRDPVATKDLQATRKATKTKKKASTPKIKPMTSEEKFGYWLDVAQYDLESAKDNLSAKRFLWSVFMCQQAIEKLAKGLYTLYVSDNTPYTHNINLIFDHFRDKLPAALQDRYDFFEYLTSCYINNRYPSFKETLSKRIDEPKAKETVSQTDEAFAWLLTLKP
jgi:HEPN domain-containing protein